MTEQDLKNQIRELIGADKLDEAIGLLARHTGDNERMDDIIIQQARYNRIRQEAIKGTKTAAEIDNELNKLRKNLLDFLRNELLTVEEPEDQKQTLAELEASLAQALTRVRVAQFLLKSRESQTQNSITSIVSGAESKSRKLVVDFLNELEKFNLLDKIRDNQKTYWALNDAGKTLIEKLFL